MLSAFGGIATIWVVIGVGWLIAHLRLVDERDRRTMAFLAFNVGSPPLMFALMVRASLEHVFSVTVLVSAGAVALAGLAWLVLSRALVKPAPGESVIGFMASSYTNAGNFGLPIAVALLGDGTWTAPILLMQIAIIQPVCLAILDAANARTNGGRVRWGRYLTFPLRNPITIGILLGLVVNLLGLTVPELVMKPVDLIGAIAVPLMLLPFGVSLRLHPLPGGGPHRRATWLATGLKVVAHPLAAYGLGRLVGLSGPELYAVVVLAALPAAQNVYVIATRYRQAELLARDAVFWTTVLSVPVLLVVAALLGP